jgi:hypothetical protein
MRFVFAAVLALGACRKEAPAAPTPVSPPAPATKGPSPTEVTRSGAYHAVQCGDVTAVFQGSAEDLKDLAVEGRPVPKTYGVKSLTFVFADGREVPFTPRGELAFSDWSFEVFSPDCSRAVLLQDRFGPYTVFTVKDLPTFANPKVVKAPGEPAAVHGPWRWTSPSSFEFVASCCGGARVHAGDLEAGTPMREVFTAEKAPAGIRPTTTGWEVIP